MNIENNNKKSVAVLFARRDSYYKEIPICDVYDKERDALNFKGGMAVVAHPPCRTWGRLAHFAKAPKEEGNLAIWAVEKVRENGGVLEHPAYSRLWEECDLPTPGNIDTYNGWSMSVPQWWWDHLAWKETWLYIVGLNNKQLPKLSFRMKSFLIRNVEDLSKRQREITPREFCEWLVELALRTRL